MDKNTLRILSFPGGGTKGYGSNRFLQKILLQSGMSFKDFMVTVDVICGTSVGGLISAGLAFGIDPFELEIIFTEVSKRIFTTPRIGLTSILTGSDKAADSQRPSMFTKSFKIAQGKAFYESYSDSSDYGSAVLKRKVVAMFGDAKLSDLKKPIIIPAFNETTKKGVVFSNIRDYDFFIGHDELISDVCLASSAAPLYLPPHSFGGNTYSDGVAVSNDPILAAINLGLTIKPNTKRIVAIVAGCGIENTGAEDTESTESEKQLDQLGTAPKDLKSTDIANQVLRALGIDIEVEKVIGDSGQAADIASKVMGTMGVTMDPAKLINSSKRNHTDLLNNTIQNLGINLDVNKINDLTNTSSKDTLFKVFDYVGIGGDITQIVTELSNFTPSALIEKLLAELGVTFGSVPDWLTNLVIPDGLSTQGIMEKILGVLNLTINTEKINGLTQKSGQDVTHDIVEKLLGGHMDFSNVKNLTTNQDVSGKILSTLGMGVDMEKINNLTKSNGSDVGRQILTTLGYDIDALKLKNILETHDSTRLINNLLGVIGGNIDVEQLGLKQLNLSWNPETVIVRLLGFINKLITAAEEWSTFNLRYMAERLQLDMYFYRFDPIFPHNFSNSIDNSSNEWLAQLRQIVDDHYSNDSIDINSILQRWNV